MSFHLAFGEVRHVPDQTILLEPVVNMSMVRPLPLADSGNGTRPESVPDEKGLDPTGTAWSTPATNSDNGDIARDPEAEAKALRKY